MADQDSPLALSSSTAPWWDLHHHATRPTLSTSSRNNPCASVVNLWENNLSPCDPEDVSISASNHSSLTIDESSHQFFGTPSSNYIIREPATDDNSHLWRQLLLGVGGGQEMRRDEMGENLLNAFSLKCFSGGMFEPSACGEDFRKLDRQQHDKWAEINGDQYPNSNTNEFFTKNLDKQSFNNNNAGYNGDSNMRENYDHQWSLNILSSSNPVSSWSIAPPDQPQLIQHIVPHPCNNNIPSVNQYLHPNITSDQAKQCLVYQPQLFDKGPSFILECENSGLNQMRQENDQRGESEQVGSNPETLFPFASFTNTNEAGYRPIGGNWRPREINMLSQHGYTPSVIDPFGYSRSRFSNKPLQNSISSLDAKKLQGTLSNSPMNNGNGRGQGALINEGKKKRSDDDFQSSGSLKKPKRFSSSSNPSTASSAVKVTNTRIPKGKVEAEKLSALQQIVSPYGKTDTASILQEAIGFIRRHQENVMMLSNPYLKSSVNKLQEAWGSLDRKGEKGERNKVLDLKSKGLCLVPVSNIPKEIKEDNSGLDYWPAYRGYLYR